MGNSGDCCRRRRRRRRRLGRRRRRRRRPAEMTGTEVCWGRNTMITIIINIILIIIGTPSSRHHHHQHQHHHHHRQRRYRNPHKHPDALVVANAGFNDLTHYREAFIGELYVRLVYVIIDIWGSF